MKTEDYEDEDDGEVTTPLVLVKDTLLPIIIKWLGYLYD